MRITGAALILVLLLSNTVCQGEENREQEKDGPATENIYFVFGIIFENIAIGAVLACIVAISLFLAGSNAVSIRSASSKVFSSFKI